MVGDTSLGEQPRNVIPRVAGGGRSFTVLVGKGGTCLTTRAVIRQVLALVTKAKLATDACMLAVFARRGRFERCILVIQHLGSGAILLEPVVSAAPKGKVGQRCPDTERINADVSLGGIDLLYSEIPAWEKRHAMLSLLSQMVVVPADHSLGMATHDESVPQVWVI